MKKDVILAIGIGFLSGAFIALLAVNLPRILKQASKPKIETIAPPLTPVPTQTVSLPINLEITNPTDESIVGSETIKITGKTAAKSTLVVDTEFDTKITESSSDGTFSLPITLKEGGNNVTTTAYNEKGEETTKTLSVFYTKEKL